MGPEVIVKVADIAERLICAAGYELRYLCCFKGYVEDFENKKIMLDVKQRSVLQAVKEAKNRNEFLVVGEVDHWIKEADNIFEVDTKKMEKCFFGWCPDCIWQYRRGKMLEKRTRDITGLIEGCNFDRVARRVELPGIKYYYSSQNFIEFESRKSEFEKLLEALKDENCSVIGLYGMGGTGKTTLAQQVGLQVENSGAFDKVIYVDVSSAPDIKKIQFDIARQLSLELEEGKEEVLPMSLWTRIAHNGKRVLLILDNMSGELKLREIGIPCGPDQGNCCVLITTSDSIVCKAMGCHPTIGLQKLIDRDALKLFVEHFGTERGDPFDEFMHYAKKIVPECEGLPNAVVAIATTLKSWPLKDWEIALQTLQQRSEPLHNFDKGMMKVYKSLRLNYDRLDESTKDVFLLCSLFPGGCEIPIKLLCKLSIGFGLFEEVHRNYLLARRKVITAKDTLTSSSLLSETKEVYVNMHSMVREMALLASVKDLQVIMDSSSTAVKSDIRFLFWSRDDFPNQFDGTKLEILVLWIKVKVKVEDSYTIFKAMAKLRVLFLHCDSDHKYVTLSLKLLHSLKNVRTLILDGWELDHMSVLENLHDLEILELTNCLIKELPNELRKLKNLRSIGLRKCKIVRNNPFEVIERCIQLEELDFVLNSNIEDREEEGETENIDEVVPEPPTLKRYYIACPHLKYFDHDYNGMFNCFNTENVKNLISNAVFKNIVRRAEVLELGEIRGEGWKNLVPDIIPIKVGGDDLIKLCLYSIDDMECLVDTNNYDLDSKVAVFSKLVELYLDDVDVSELYQGPMISGFLEQLLTLKLRNCKNMSNVFDSDLKLPHLKVLHLINCPIMFESSIFQSSVAQSLEQLEELIISNFEELKRIVDVDEKIMDADKKDSYRTLFPNLRTLEIEECGKLELISPLLYAKDLPLLESIIIRKCEELKHIFGECRRHYEGQVLHQEIMFPSLTKMVLDDVPNIITLFQESNLDIQRPAPNLKDDSEKKFARRAAFSWARVCCFLPTIKDTDNVVSNDATLQDHAISPELQAPRKGIQKFHTFQCLLRRPLNLQNIRQMTIVQCSNLMSLFTLFNATTVKLEKLTIQRCHKLKHVITNEEEDHDHRDCISIFPKLEELLIVDCRYMEFIFPPTFSVRLEKLKFVIIKAAPKLKYVFGRFGPGEYLSNEIENKELSIDLPALETLSLTDVPNMISICSNGRRLNLETAKEFPASRKGIQTFHTAECLLTQPLKLQNIRQMTIVQCSNLMSLFAVSIATTVKLEKLTIQRCDKLKHVITNEERDHDHIGCISIFPKLEELLIVDCRNMESIFPSTSSVRLQKLKFVIVKAAPKLTYVFGRFGGEEYLSNGNENQELCIDLPALEIISLTDVPNVIGISTNGRQLSLETAKNLTSQGEVESKIEEISGVERPMTSSVSTDVVKLQHLREIKIIECRKIKAMFPASTWRSLSQLCKLCILNCEELVHVVDDDSKDYDRFRDNYSLPKLEYLQIQNCNKLVFIFPSSFLRGLPKLKSMIVEEAVDLEYIFGDYLSNENEKGRFKVDLPALETLALRDLPKIINICAQRYSVSLPSLQQIGLDNCQELTRDSQNLMVYWKPSEDKMKISMIERKLTNLEIGNSTIDEVFNLEGVKVGGLVRLGLQSIVLKNLSELKQMCKGPKRILSLYNLRSLKVIGCERLRTIFSISILKSLPNLFHLKIKDCIELVHIIEEDPEERVHDDWLELSFPKLEKIHIQICHSLKFLFSISTPNMFPKLERLEIEEASKLEQIFTCKQDDTQKMVVKDGVPNLSCLRLIKLPKLVTIGWGIEFQTLTDHQVVDCPKYQEITSQQVQQEPENLDLDDQAATEDPLSPHYNNVQGQTHMGETSSLTNLAESTEETLKETEVKEPTPALEKRAFETSTAKSIPGRASLHELKDEQTMKEQIGQLQYQDLGETKATIEVPQETNIPIDDDDLKKTKPTSETIMTHWQEQREIISGVIESIPRETGIMEPKHHTRTIYSEAGSSQSGPCTTTDKETGKEIDKAVPASELPTTNTSQDSEVDGLKETAEQGFQGHHDKLKEDIITIQQNSFGLRTQSKELSRNSETGKEVVGIAVASEASLTTTSSNSKVDSVKETMGQCFQEHDASPETTIAAQSADLEPRKYSKSSKTGKEAGGILLASQSSMFTTSTNSESTKEAAMGRVDISPMEEAPFDSTVEQKLDNASQPSLPNNDTPSLYHRSSQIGPASLSPTLGILEIFQIVELKDGEATLLAKALEQYPQLLLPREQRAHPIIAFSYRVLVDILVMLATKTPCTITTSEKSTLENNLCAATILGFDKGWIDWIRAKVFGIDMSDVSPAQEKIRVMEAQLENCDMILKQVQEEKEEARRHLEMAQGHFDAIDSKLLGLLEDRNTLKANIISAKDTPFGI